MEGGLTENIGQQLLHLQVWFIMVTALLAPAVGLSCWFKLGTLDLMPSALLVHKGQYKPAIDLLWSFEDWQFDFHGVSGEPCFTFVISPVATEIELFYKLMFEGHVE
ncbi:unnamed protein product [Calypogeia fissa]